MANKQWWWLVVMPSHYTFPHQFQPNHLYEQWKRKMISNYNASIYWLDAPIFASFAFFDQTREHPLGHGLGKTKLILLVSNFHRCLAEWVTGGNHHYYHHTFFSVIYVQLVKIKMKIWFSIWKMRKRNGKQFSFRNGKAGWFLGKLKQ